MPLRFGANLNFLFCENSRSVLEKFSLSRSAGFRGVEIACPDQFTKEEVASVQKENDIEVVLINISLGKGHNYFILWPQCDSSRYILALEACSNF